MSGNVWIVVRLCLPGQFAGHRGLEGWLAGEGDVDESRSGWRARTYTGGSGRKRAAIQAVSSVARQTDACRPKWSAGKQ